MDGFWMKKKWWMDTKEEPQICSVAPHWEEQPGYLVEGGAGREAEWWWLGGVGWGVGERRREEQDVDNNYEGDDKE